MESTSGTPPHHPTHRVHLSIDEIQAILRIRVSDLESYTISRLPQGQSYNNRIYFVDNTQGPGNSYVLKVNGKVFGAAKVENEVSCLRILQHFCPDIPVPHVTAWSLGGQRVDRPDDASQSKKSSKNLAGGTGKHGWILMTRLHGSAIDVKALTAEDMSSLSTQLAQMVQCWRVNVPKSVHCGNLRFTPESEAETGDLFQHTIMGPDLRLRVQGILDIGLDATAQPMDTNFSYWKAKLFHATEQLGKQEVYAANREALSLTVQDFIRDSLPKLRMFQHVSGGGDRFVFSHTDLAPRNVLVAGNPLRISGIVDFEFSGFFPDTTEFTGSSIVSDEEDDEGWPSIMHTKILKCLEDANVATPLRLRNTEPWRELIELKKLELNIAPWWMSAGNVRGEELDQELKAARKNALDALSLLRQTVGGR